MTEPDAAGPADGSFFAARLAETHTPYELPVGDLVLEVPDGEQVAALDDTRSTSEELEVLVGEQFDDLVDVLDELRWSIATTTDELLEHWGLDETPAIEYDLLMSGQDLLDWFRGRWSFDHLLRILDRLPPGSHYRSALADDDDLAAKIAEAYGPPSKRKKRTRPPLEGFTTEVAYLHRLVDGVRFAGWAALAAQATKRGRPPAPSKGPETADDRWEFADYLREHEDIASRLLVRKGGSRNRQAQREPSPEVVRGGVLLDPDTSPGSSPPGP